MTDEPTVDEPMIELTPEELEAVSGSGSFFSVFVHTGEPDQTGSFTLSA